MTPIFKNILHTGNAEKRAFYALLGIIAVLMLLYAYFVNTTVLNIVARRSIGATISQVSSEVSVYEFKYMEYKNTITFDFSNEKGFVEANDTTFVARTPDTRVTFNE